MTQPKAFVFSSVMFLGILISHIIDAAIIYFKLHRDWEWYSIYVNFTFLILAVFVAFADVDKIARERFGSGPKFEKIAWRGWLTIMALAFAAMFFKWYIRDGDRYSL